MLKSPVQYATAPDRTTIAVDTEIAIPVNAQGNLPRYVILETDVDIGFKLIQSGETPALSTMCMLRAEQPLIVNVSGYDAIYWGYMAGVPRALIQALENQ